METNFPEQRTGAPHRRALLVLLLIVVGGLWPIAIEAADSVQRLATILRSAADYKQRLAAAIGLARLKDARAVPALIRALGDPHPTVRGACAGALAKLGDPRSMPALEALLKREKDAFVLGQVQSALAALLRGPNGKAGPLSEMQVAGALGSIDEDAAQEVVRRRERQATACYQRELQSTPYLAGKVELKFRVRTDGKVGTVYLRNSDLGSLSAEQCMLAEMRRATFSAPEGGEAEVTAEMEFESSRPILWASAEAVSRAAAKLRKSCKKLLRGLSLPRGLRLAMYVEVDGTIASAGLAAEGEIASAVAQEFVSRVKAVNLGPRPGGGTVKIVTPFTCPSR